MTKQINIIVPMDKIMGGRLRRNSIPKEIEVLTEEIHQDNFLIKLRFEPGSLTNGFIYDPFADDDIEESCGMGTTD